MILTSSILVGVDIEKVNQFFDNPHNLARWDRSVKEVILTSTGNIGVGFTFDTVAPSGKRMSYIVREYTRGKYSTVSLVNDKMFKTADWTMKVSREGSWTRVSASVDFSPYTRFYFLNIILMLNKKALFRDLIYLKNAIEKEQVG